MVRRKQRQARAHELEVLKGRRERVYQRIGRLAAPVDDGSPADLEHMSEWQSPDGMLMVIPPG